MVRKRQYYTKLLIWFQQFNQADLLVTKHLIKQQRTLQNKHFTLIFMFNSFKQYLKQRKMIYKQLIYFQDHVSDYFQVKSC